MADRSFRPFAGKVALVTGSGSGIGEAVARRLAAEGASVITNSHSSRGHGEELAAELPDAAFVQADVSDEKDAARLVEAASDRWGQLDIVVNSAGWSTVVPFADLEAQTDELWKRCLDVNLMGIWYVSRAAAPLLRRSEDGSITNVTSAAGLRAAGSSIPYAVSKAAANHLTKLLARALAPEVRVNAVAPGFIETPLTASMPPEFRQTYLETAVLHRTGTPDDVADACLFLARSTFATGEITVLDGGLSLA
jgi:ketoreductase RED2